MINVVDAEFNSGWWMAKVDELCCEFLHWFYTFFLLSVLPFEKQPTQKANYKEETYEANRVIYLRS
jgi:hypothetical protein